MTNANTNPPEQSPTRKWSRLGLRALLIFVALAASFSAGWVSHRSWNQRHMKQTISNAVRQIGGPVQVEAGDDLGVLILKGRKVDVEKLQGAIDEVEAAALL